MILSVKNEQYGLGNSMVLRIIVELLCQGGYIVICILARANTGIWLFAQANMLEYWLFARDIKNDVIC